MCSDINLSHGTLLTYGKHFQEEMGGKYFKAFRSLKRDQPSGLKRKKDPVCYKAILKKAILLNIKDAFINYFCSSTAKTFFTIREKSPAL